MKYFGYITPTSCLNRVPGGKKQYWSVLCEWVATSLSFSLSLFWNRARWNYFATKYITTPSRERIHDLRFSNLTLKQLSYSGGKEWGKNLFCCLVSEALMLFRAYVGKSVVDRNDISGLPATECSHTVLVTSCQIQISCHRWSSSGTVFQRLFSCR